MLFETFEKRFPTVTTCLSNASRTGKLAHAYLVYGDTPEIRHNAAVLLAQLAICPQSSVNGKPCGTCQLCSQLERGIYSELYELSPTGKIWQIAVGDRKNPDPNTTRWFESQFYLTSTASGRKKIGIIYDADRMNTESQNAFLKTLEEPPADSFIILTTGNPSALLPTTRSRCQTLMLLENRCNFDFARSGELYRALFELCFGENKNVATAEREIAVIIDIANHLQEHAEAKVNQEWAERMAQATEMESPVRKRFEKQYESAVAGEYLKLRRYFIGAINTWLGQLYLLACGAALAELPNPQLFDGLPLPQHPEEKMALKALNEAEKLSYNLLFNVNEELAIRSFGLNLALRCN